VTDASWSLLLVTRSAPKVLRPRYFNADARASCPARFCSTLRKHLLCIHLYKRYGGLKITFCCEGETLSLVSAAFVSFAGLAMVMLRASSANPACICPSSEVSECIPAVKDAGTVHQPLNTPQPPKDTGAGEGPSVRNRDPSEGDAFLSREGGHNLEDVSGSTICEWPEWELYKAISVMFTVNLMAGWLFVNWCARTLYRTHVLCLN
jgi:hypothetical protein